MDRPDMPLDALYRAALLGSAAGDALGAPVEFLSRDAIERHHGRLTEMVGGGRFGWAPGEWTDDTAMTLAVAEGLLAAPGDLDAQVRAIGERFLAWFASSPKDVGSTIHQALSAFRGDWPAAARATPAARAGRAAGNGSLMRTLPVALAFADEEALLVASARISAMTHFDPLAETCCAAHGLWIRRLLAGSDARRAWEEALATARDRATRGAPADPRQAPGWAPADDPLWSRLERAPRLAMQQLQPTGYAGFVVHCLEAAVAIVVQAASYEEAMVEIVNLGGETDTMAAVAGGPAALAYRPDPIPARWLATLAGRERLESAALGLARLATAVG